MLLVAGDILRRTARRLPRKTAIICGGQRLSFAELDAAANRLAQALIRHGIGKGDVVAIMSSNLPEYGIALYGVARAGAVLANINARSHASDVARVLALAAPTTALVEAGLLPVLREARDKSAPHCRIVAFGADAAAASHGAGDDTVTLAEFEAGASADEPHVPVAEDDPLGLTFTGGTTGVPKGVLVSHRSRGLSALACIIDFDLGEEDIAAVSTPLFHSAGLYIWFHPAMMTGASTMFLPRWDCQAFMTEVERHAVTAAVLVPTQLNDLVKHPEFDAGRLRSLRKINHAGMSISPALIEHVQRVMPWAELTNNYGCSEAGCLTARRPHHLPDKITSVGRPVFNVELEVRGPEGGPLPPGQVGEVTTRGDHLMIGYYKDPEATAESYKSGDEWFWTGDLGYVDEDGFLVLVDRSKDIVVQGGENIFPLEIENALYQHPAVLECAVVGAPDERLGEVPVAEVVLRAGMRSSEAELIEFCLARLARHKRPRQIALVDALPKTAVGKIQKHKIRDAYWACRERRI